MNTPPDTIMFFFSIFFKGGRVGDQEVGAGPIRQQVGGNVQRREQTQTVHGDGSDRMPPCDFPGERSLYFDAPIQEVPWIYRDLRVNLMLLGIFLVLSELQRGDRVQESRCHTLRTRGNRMWIKLANPHRISQRTASKLLADKK